MKRNKVLEAGGVVALSTIHIVRKFLNYINMTWKWCLKPEKWAKIDLENLDLGDKIMLATLQGLCPLVPY